MRTLTAISIFLVLFSLLWIFKPKIAFNEDGSLKSFGSLKGSRTTLFPIWWWIIILSIVAYLSMTIVKGYWTIDLSME